MSGLRDKSCDSSQFHSLNRKRITGVSVARPCYVPPRAVGVWAGPIIKH